MVGLIFTFFCVGLDDIKLLYNLKRYSDCIVYCDKNMLNNSSNAKIKVQLYKVKSMYHLYNRELMERIERQHYLPGFEYKEMMRAFGRSHILEVIKTLAYVKKSAERRAPEDSTTPKFDNEAAYMLDKALLDYLVYNTREISICLLCHSTSQKLVHSHYIPKAILQDFVKVLGLDAGESVFIFSPKKHPSNWKLQSAAKATFSMLCKTCDGTVLSKDENSFKVKFFSLIYKDHNSHFHQHFITYTQYLYKFAVGLMFRNIAPCYSDICSEIGEFRVLHSVMQSCREIIFGTISPSNVKPKIYLLTLPSQLPSSLSQIYGWSKYVMMTNSPYGAYKLLQPGEPMIPKLLYCFMVKIGVMVFVLSLDEDLDKELEKMCPLFEIQSSEVATDCDFIMTIPGNLERSKHIPQKLWWSILGWTKLEINTSLSIGLSVKPPTKLSLKFQDGAWIKDVLNSAAQQHVCANLLPPGFELNFEKYNTLPEKVIVVPDGHAILLHSSIIKTTSDSKCYAVIGKKVSTESTSNTKPLLYSIKTQPYVLVCLQDVGKKIVIKTGFFIDDASLQVEEALPGVPASMKESLQLKELIEQIPNIVCAVLREKGFMSLKSLLLWQQSSFFDRKSDK